MEVSVKNDNPLVKVDQGNKNLVADIVTQTEGWPVYHRLVHIHETDQDGVVHFSNYLKISEEAMFTGFRFLGFPFENTGHSVAMLNSSVDYFKPMHFGDRIDVVLSDSDAKRVKFSLTFDFMKGDVLCARVKLMLVTIVIESRQSIPLPKDIKTKLSNAKVKDITTALPHMDGCEKIKMDKLQELK